MALACGTPSAPPRLFVFCIPSGDRYAETESVVLIHVQTTAQVLRRLLVTNGILVKRIARASRKRVNESLTKAPPSWAPN